MQNDIQSRLRSKVLWLAIASQLGIILVTLGIFDNTVLGEYKTIVNALLVILGSFGIINNPIDKNHLWINSSKYLILDYY